jgi:uncharacterized membrane protein YqiK
MHRVTSGDPITERCKVQDLSKYIPIAVGVILVLIALRFVFKSFNSIGPTEVGLVTKRFGKKLRDGNVIAMNGEAGFQAELLMPGWRFKLWPVYTVDKYDWVQVPAGEIGVVIAQVGGPLPTGAKSAEYKDEFGDFRDLNVFLDGGGQKGVQRPVLPPGSMAPIHPVAFLIVTSGQVYGEPVSPDLPTNDRGNLSASSFGLRTEDLYVTTITPQRGDDVMGIVTVLEGEPLSKGDIASRLGGYADIAEMELQGKSDSEIIAALLGTKNSEHNNYQDFQAFLDHGGRIGLQHDPLLYGAYLLNPFLVKVEIVPMIVVEQGEVAVIKSYVGLAAEDTSGETFKFGSIVKPGHQGIWSEVLRTGKYAINPRCYSAEIVPTSILTLNWATATSEAHDLDQGLSAIDAKSREGFVFKIDLQVQIHVPDTKAARVISTVGTMLNLVNEVLQSAVGNYFRNSLQELEAIKFIETRSEVQAEAEAYVKEYLSRYDVEVRGVYIQDVVLPQQLVEVLTAREIAKQSKETYEQEKQAEETRKDLEQARGTAAAQADLARSQVEIAIEGNKAEAREATARGEAAFTTATGKAKAEIIEATGRATAAAIEAEGLARAAGYTAQKDAVGAEATALVAALGEIGKGGIDLMPDVLVMGGGSSLDGLAATLIDRVRSAGLNGHNGNSATNDTNGTRETEPVAVSATSASEKSASAV